MKQGICGDKGLKIQAMNETKNLKFQNLAAFQILAFEIPRQLPDMNYMNSNKETGS